MSNMRTKLTYATLLLLTASQGAMAQAADAAGTVEKGMNSTLVMLLFTMVGLLLLVLLFLSRIFHTLRTGFYGEQPRAVPAVTWKKISATMQETVPVEEEKYIMIDHEYDGIRELDNNLPLWWRYMFYATIAFSVIYLVRYHMAGGSLQGDEYKKELADAAVQKEEYRKKHAEEVDETTVTMMDPSGISAGKTLFTENCRACHGGAGEGGIGPNLTDDHWLHGGGIKNIFKTIKYGWPDKGMKSWQAELRPLQIQQVASYIMSLHGTNPPGAKEPQGEIYKDEGAPAANDSLKADSVRTAAAEIK